MAESFVFKWRVIEPWHEPDGVSLFSRAGNIFTWAGMLDLRPSTPLGRYVAQVRDWGFNGMALYADPEKNPEAMRAFATHLRGQGIGMIIRREWCETETGHSWPETQSEAFPRTSRKVCPYGEGVRAYWADRVAWDFEMIPDLAGYRMNGTEFYGINGAPWMCDCARCNATTPRERVRDAIGLIAGLLEARGATLFWETCQDDPWGQRHEGHYFTGLTGEIPENAFVLLKRFYWDYHPRWPRHPLFDSITRDAQGRSPYLTSIQQPGEYRGVHDFPWCMVDEWSDAFRDVVATGQQGVWVMAIVHPEGWDHPLNMVNWHGIARFMLDPHVDPVQVKMDWAREEFGEEVAPVVVDVVHKVTEAARGMYEFDALWTANHSYFPNLEYLDSHLCGPYRQMKRMTGMMGLALPLDMYSPERAAGIRADPRTRMVFNQVLITPRLKAEVMAQKEAATRLMRESIALWRSLEGKMDGDKYHRVLAGLEGNLDDTVVFRYGMDLYMDWKLGVLTEARIDSALEACRGLRGRIVPEPLADETERLQDMEPVASLKTLGEQLRRELREPWVEEYWRHHPLGVGVLEPEVEPGA